MDGIFLLEYFTPADDILQKPSDPFPYTELLLSYTCMIKFETGWCSCHEDDVHQRKESQIKGELSLINHKKGEQITVA